MSSGSENRSSSTDETVAGLSSAELAPTDVGLVAGFHTGQVLEQRYRLVTRIGRGAMGEVWEAQHVTIGRRVAIKLITPNAVHSDLATRLQREAEFVARLEHPNIVAVTDFGLVAAGAPFVVMERLTGRTLAELITERGRLDPATARQIFDQLAAGLAHAHHAGIVHRDLKPSNVFVLDDTAGPVRVKIIDFGIAKATAIDASDRALTRVGAVFGTPAYMAPEQIRGDVLDARVDLYALGAILYEMLVGEPPWRRRTSVEVMYCHLFEPTPSLRLRVPDAPAELDALVMWCMAKDRTLRPPDADTVRRALLDHGLERGATVLPHEVPPVPPPELRARYATDPTVAPPARSKASRSRMPWFVAGGLALAAMFVAGGLALRHRRHRVAEPTPAVVDDAAPAAASTTTPPDAIDDSAATETGAPPPSIEPPVVAAPPASAVAPSDGTVMRDVPPPRPHGGRRKTPRDGNVPGTGAQEPIADIREPFAPAPKPKPKRKRETYEWPDP